MGKEQINWEPDIVKGLDIVKNSHYRMGLSFEMIRDAQEKAAKT